VVRYRAGMGKAHHGFMVLLFSIFLGPSWCLAGPDLFVEFHTVDVGNLIDYHGYDTQLELYLLLTVDTNESKDQFVGYYFVGDLQTHKQQQPLESLKIPFEDIPLDATHLNFHLVEGSVRYPLEKSVERQENCASWEVGCVLELSELERQHLRWLEKQAMLEVYNRKMGKNKWFFRSYMWEKVQKERVQFWKDVASASTSIKTVPLEDLHHSTGAHMLYFSSHPFVERLKFDFGFDVSLSR
tara:strand:+ start:7924 stop:8646 length:723 start_codon:yes stop_codon:yes gene_type:complete